MRRRGAIILCMIALCATVQAQVNINGMAVDSLGKGIQRVTVSEQGTSRITSTDSEGRFALLTLGNKGYIVFHSIGYGKVVKPYGPQTTDMSVTLLETSTQIEEITVSTGYQNIPRERATGSFSTVGKELFNQQVGTDILSRLPNIANSLVMDNGRSPFGQMMVRGLSTINGPQDPLVVVDNFPYDGDINNINPNIVEHITILKDAAASSIWGARAANGVIVITTKTGQFNQPTNIEFNSSLAIGQNPNLGYIPQMSSSDFIDVEQELYGRGFYRSRINSIARPLLSPVVDMLDQVDRGAMAADEAQRAIEIYRTKDARDDFDRYMYRPLFNRQYFLGASGGSEKFSWTSSAGLDRNRQTLGDTYQRINLRFQNTYRPMNRLSLSTNLYYTQTQSASGRYGYTDLPNYVPYMQMADEDGIPLPMGRNYRQSYIEAAGDGMLLDWNFYPLLDWQHQTSRRNSSDMLATAALQYDIAEGLRASVNYQYERQTGLNTSLADEDSYAARDYINRFTQIPNGEVVYVVPRGGILDKSNSLLEANNIRSQLSFDNTYGKHHISAITGAEARSTSIQTHGERFYGYNPHNLTTGNVDYTRGYPSFVNGANAFILNGQNLGETDTRFLSQFANAAYTYGNRYTLSTSLRRDASNLFGLKTNDQWNPFWSAGFAWKISNERFYRADILSYLNLRATYGFSGNVDPAMVAVNTIRFLSPSVFTGFPAARFDNYYNPHLKWETSRMLNMAVDFRSGNNRFTGTVEYYRKKAENLFGASPTDYTTGVDPYMLRNVANMEGSGWDIELKSVNIDRAFKWNTILNFSLYEDRIKEYHIERTLAQEYVNTYSPPISGVEGRAVFGIFAYKWVGLDPETGEAQGYLDGEVSKNYGSITGTGTKVEDLEYFGSAIPTRFGSLINAISYKNLSLQFAVSYKFGYWFRRPSINYTDLFNNWIGHSDYGMRWQEPGDELITDVPVNPYTTNAARDRFYSGAGILVERGDHIRLQYINIGYDINRIWGIKGLHMYLNIHNLGLIWKANKSGIDPDFNIGTGRVVTPANYAVGFRTKF